MPFFLDGDLRPFEGEEDPFLGLFAPLVGAIVLILFMREKRCLRKKVNHLWMAPKNLHNFAHSK
jgi:hypothetical protein